MTRSSYLRSTQALHSYLVFVGAGIVLVLVPGPDMIDMLSRCIAQGRKAGLMGWAQQEP